MERRIEKQYFIYLFFLYFYYNITNFFHRETYIVCVIFIFLLCLCLVSLETFPLRGSYV